MSTWSALSILSHGNEGDVVIRPRRLAFRVSVAGASVLNGILFSLMARLHPLRFCSWLCSWCSHGNSVLLAWQMRWWHRFVWPFPTCSDSTWAISLLFTIGEWGHYHQINESPERLRLSVLSKVTRPVNHRVNRGLGKGRGRTGAGSITRMWGGESIDTWGNEHPQGWTDCVWLCYGPNVSHSFLPP